MLTITQIHDRLTALLADIDALPVAASSTFTLKLGDNLPSILASAVAGSTFILPPGYTFAGDFHISKPATLISTLPITGRATPGEAFPTLSGTIVVDAPDVNFLGVGLTGSTASSTILTTGLRTKLDHCFIHGNVAGQHRGIAVNSGSVSVLRTYIDNIWASQDTQAISGWDGTADLLVDDCYLEASGENFILGGADASSQANIPQRVTLQNCTITKNLAWRGVTGITIKNLLELKNATDVTIQNNIGTYSWLNGQDGYAMLLTVRNQDGTNPYATIARVKVMGNSWSHVGAGIQILGQDDTLVAGVVRPSVKMTDILIQNETFTDVDPSLWGGAGRQVFIGGGPKNLTLDNLNFSGLHLNSAFSFGDDPTLLCENLVVKGGRYQEGDYGIKCAGFAPGLPSLQARAPGYTWSGVTMQIGNPLRSDGATKGTIPYPTGTTVIP